MKDHFLVSVVYYYYLLLFAEELLDGPRDGEHNVNCFTVNFDIVSPT